MSTILTAPTNFGLVGAWSFDEGSGDTAHDFSGNGNHGTLVNSPTWVDGILGKALKFNGSNNNIVLPSKTPFVFNEITVSLWVNFRDFLTNTQFIAKYYTTSPNTNKRSWQLRTGASDSTKNTINITLSPDGTSSNLTVLSFGTRYTLNMWNYLVFTYKFVTNGTSQINLYFNGKSDGSSTTANGPIFDSTLSPTIGGTLNGSFSNVIIDDVRIYNRILTQNEITTLYNSGATKLLAATNSGLVGHWTFDDIGDGNTAHDFSGNQNHGTLVNSPTWVDGILGKAMRFNGAGSGEGINLGISSSINNALNDKFSICYWIKRTGSNNQVIFGKKNATHSRMIGYNIWAASSQSFVDENQAVKLSIVDNYANLWTYWIWIYNGTLLTAFINGKQVGQVSTSFSASYNNNSFIGYNGAITSQSFTGLLDDIRIYNRALNQSEITTLYNAGLSKLS